VSYRYNLGLAFHDIAAQHAERPALRLAGGGTITYRDLDCISNRIARGLQKSGLGRGDVLGLFNSKTAHGFAAMLAALKVGAAYVNLDDQNPPQRLENIFRSCSPRLVATDLSLPLPLPLGELCSRMGLSPVALCTLAQDRTLSDQDLPETARVTGTDPAYLMFTSGSTGIPKGAMIAHQSVLNLISWSQAEFAISPNDVLTNVNPLYFDNSVFDFYSALFSGAALAPVPRDIVKQPDKLVSMVQALGCTLWFSVPSMLIYLMTMKQLSADSWPAMRCLVFGGEGYPKSELKKLFGLFGQRAKFVNVYGPTECTCICSAYPITEADLAGPPGLPPLGCIAPNFEYLILDDDDRRAARGDVGELCLLGPQVGLGYCNDPERTAASFVQNPLNKAIHERMYRSGDLVREGDNGLLWFVGRKDNQIKHMGYRIELEDIEAALNGLPYVIQSAAVYKRVRDQHGRIVAFISSAEAMDEQRVRADLRACLPDYMIPGRVIVLRELPKNANGKIDRRELLAHGV
jgi:D-alanine--poly(phosphoribitol) ligase subunit 1